MIWINDVIVDYEKAVNALNFDKLGHETGLGSWGVKINIEDSFDDNLSLYLGLKFDVLSIITNRYLTTFVNIPRAYKEQISKLEKDAQLNHAVSSVSTFVPDINADTVIDFYIDVHKVSIDIVEFANTVYQYVDTTEAYSAITRDKVFLSGSKKAARGVSAKMLRVYDGNLENFGFIFTRDSIDFVLNEMIVKDDLIHDEIKYTYWLTPHDREEYKFFHNNGNVPAEQGSDFITGLGNEKIGETETDKLYQYDRRGMRAGYYDVTVEDPIVNHGFFDGNIESSDTFQFARDSSLRFHKHAAQVSINSSYRQHISPYLATLLDSALGGERTSVASHTVVALSRREMHAMFTVCDRGPCYLRYDSDMENSLLADLLQSMQTLIPNEPVDAVAHINELSSSTVVMPFVIQNKIHDFRALHPDELKECIIFIYHPIIDKFVFYEMGSNDVAEITQQSLLFNSDGTQYGIDMRGPYPVFVWSNFKKRFRDVKSRWMNMKGQVTSMGRSFEAVQDPVENLFVQTDCKIPVYDDLTFQGDCAKIIAINKEDVRNLLSKTSGVVDSEFVFGIKTGDIEISRSGLWM